MQSYTGALETAQPCGQLNMTPSGWKVDKQTRRKKQHLWWESWISDRPLCHVISPMLSGRKKEVDYLSCLHWSVYLFLSSPDPKLLDLTEAVSWVDQNMYSSDLSKLKSTSLHLLDVKVGPCRALCAWAVFENIPATALLGNNQGFMKHRRFVL